MHYLDSAGLRFHSFLLAYASKQLSMVCIWSGLFAVRHKSPSLTHANGGCHVAVVFLFYSAKVSAQNIFHFPALFVPCDDAVARCFVYSSDGLALCSPV